MPIRSEPMEQRVRALVAVNEGVRSGGPLSALEMVRLLRTHGFEVTAVFRRGGPLVPVFRGVATRVLEQPGGWIVPWLDRARFRGIPVPGWHDRGIARRVIGSVDPHIVVAETMVCAEYAAVGREMALPSMINVREHPPTLDLWLRVHGGASRFKDVQIVANSRATASIVADRLETDVGTVTVVHPPVALHRPDAGRPEDGRRQLVLGVGRASRVKGTDLFLQVAHQVGRDGADVTFRWLGDGPLLPRLRRHTRRSATRTEFVGNVRDTEPHFRDAALVLIPSRRESFSRVAVEALSHGVPVVASDVGGLPEAVGPGGVLVEPTADALVQAVRDLLHEPQRRHEFGRAGQDWVRERFGIDAYRETMAPVLERLVQRTIQ